MVEINRDSKRVGQQVGDYRLLRLLGDGSFGEVYLAEHLRNHSQAAIKILQARLTRSEELKAFINEARTFRLKHPHIVPLLDFGITPNEEPYLIMEYAPRGTLRERHPSDTQVPLPTVVSYVNQIASALQYAHDFYLIHRDVKPENMLVGANGDILLTDFGIAAVAHNSYTLSKQQEGIGGTVSYMAPEQIEGKPRPASDQYALGVLAYEWLSGKKPFHGTPTEVMMQHISAPPTSFSHLTPSIPAEVEQVIFTALAKDPTQRFGSIQSFATAFTQASQLQQSSPLLLQSSPPGSSLLLSAATMTETIPPMLSNPANDGLSPHSDSATRWRRSKLSHPPLHNGPHWGKITLLIALVLLIIAGGTTFAAFTLYNTPKEAPIAKATAMPVATPTAPDVHTDPGGFYTWLTSRQPANVQSFANATLGLDASSDCTLANETYQVSAQPAAGSVILTSCMAEQTNYVNFAFQVDLTMVKSETAGLIFRSNSVLNASYLFEVNSDNTCFLNDSNLSLDTQNALISQKPFSGKTTNTLTVIAQGPEISLFVNGNFLAQVNDATTGSGQIGFFVDAMPTDQGSALANFSNLKIWTLS
jgi:serine/threonine protein kinase